MGASHYLTVKQVLTHMKIMNEAFVIEESTRLYFNITLMLETSRPMIHVTL